jgi:hypothetical protein
MSMTDKIVANVMNPVPILQQESSMITTNPFIPNKQKELEIEMIQEKANEYILQQYREHSSSSIRYITLDQFMNNISSSCIGFMDDMFKKPEDTDWSVYIIDISTKDQRYAYFGILFIIIAVIILVLRSGSDK